METNRNYSFRRALAISECYEATGAYRLALRYAWQAKTKSRYYSPVRELRQMRKL